jgi:phenylacetic acid degradation operon negative regulatory protein
LVSVLLTEYVLKRRGFVRTATLVDAMGVLGATEPSTRQAIRRLAHDGIIESDGPSVWRLTETGERTLVNFRSRHQRAVSGRDRRWDGRWLLVRTTVPETQRDLRHQLRTDLSFHGFGSLGQGWWIHADVDAEPLALQVLARLGLMDTALTFGASSSAVGTPEAIVNTAWNLDEVQARFESVLDEFRRKTPRDEAKVFAAWTMLLQRSGWALAIDPGLPRDLLPEDWVGREVTELVRDRYQRWEKTAARWWADHDQEQDRTAGRDIPAGRSSRRRTTGGRRGQAVPGRFALWSSAPAGTSAPTMPEVLSRGPTIVNVGSR